MLGRRAAGEARKEWTAMEARRDYSTAWTGWVGFAAIMAMIIGSLDFFEGLIAIIRKQYYAVTPEHIIVVNTTTWGWVTLLWGIVVFCAGLGLAAKAGWARWFTIIVVTLNLIGQLGWLGSSQYPLWSLTLVALQIVVLFALTARWGQVEGPA
jgi:hypothetical protein